jgi:hypothetical protein
MTLANFNSNFNWQLRALQRAADCCTTVIGPVSDCYYYVQVNDIYCLSFSAQTQEWELNGLPFFGNWYNLMVNPPYGPIGGATYTIDPLTGCGPFNASSFYFWTFAAAPPPPLIGADSLGNPVSYFFNGPICGKKCYEGTIRSNFGSSIVYGMNTAEFNISDYTIFVDLLDPAVDVNFTNALSIYYGPGASGSVVVVGPDEYTLTIRDINSLGTQVNIFMDDGVTVGVLNEIPC